MPFYRRVLRFWSFIDTQATLAAAAEALKPKMSFVSLHDLNFRLKSYLQGTPSYPQQLSSSFSSMTEGRSFLNRKTAISSSLSASARGSNSLVKENNLDSFLFMAASGQSFIEQEHALNTFFMEDEDAKGTLQTGIFLTNNYSLDEDFSNPTFSMPLVTDIKSAFSEKSAITHDQFLKNCDRIILSSKEILSQEHGLSFKSSLSATSTSRLSADDDLSLSITSSFIVKSNILIDHKLTQRGRLSAEGLSRASISFPLRTVHALKVRTAFPLICPISLKTQIIDTSIQNVFLRAGAPLSLKASLKGSLVNPLKQTTLLALSFKVVSFLKDIVGVALLKNAFKSTGSLTNLLKAGFPLKETERLTISMQTELRQVSFLRMQCRVTSVSFNNILQKQLLSCNGTLAITANVRAKFPLSLKNTCALTLSSLSNVAAPNNYESETYALLNRMNPIPTSLVFRDAINTYIKNLKAAGVWVKLDFLYVFAMDGRVNACLNWVSSRFTATEVGTIPFTPYKGYTFSVLGSYLNTGHNPTTSTGILFAKDNAHLAVRTLNANGTTMNDIGNDTAFLNSHTALGNYSPALNSSAINLAGVSVSGSFIATRNTSTSLLTYINGVGPTTTANTSTAIGATNITIPSGLNVISNRQIAFASIGAVLNSTQAKSLTSETDTLLHVLGAI